MNFVTPFPFSHDVVPLIYSIKGCLNNTVRGSWVRYLGPKTKVGIYCMVPRVSSDNGVYGYMPTFESCDIVSVSHCRQMPRCLFPTPTCE